MLIKSKHQSKALSDSRLPASTKIIHPPPHEDPVQLTSGLKMDSDTSRILIVDDDPGILNLVSKMAIRLGYHTTTAMDAVDALFYLKKTHFDLVITDYKMPVMDGYQLADRIKEKFFGTRVIIMTGQCEEDVAYMMNGPGVVDGLLLKPFNLETMKAKVESVIRPQYGQWAH